MNFKRLTREQIGNKAERKKDEKMMNKIQTIVDLTGNFWMGYLDIYLNMLCAVEMTNDQGTYFEDGVFIAQLSFPQDYPLNPPKMK